MNAQAQNLSPDIIPGSSTESGIFHFRDMKSGLKRRPKAFAASLLSQQELNRIRQLFPGPQLPVETDTRLANLGLAKNVFGKTVATKAAWDSIWKVRYEVRRGNDKRPLKIVKIIESESFKEAMTKVWHMARSDVGERWQYHLVQSGEEPSWTIFLPPPRACDQYQLRPYVLEINKI